MGRKLVKHGESTLMVSLPARWLKRHGFRKGDEVDIEENGKQIIINPGTKAERKAVIRLRYEDHPIYRSLIGSYYRAGFNEIRVDYTDRRVAGKLQGAIDSLFGLEIVNINPTNCTMKTVFDEGNIDVDSHFAKAIQIVTAMQNQLMDDFVGGKLTGRDELLQYRASVMRERDLICRLSMSLEQPGKDISAHYIYNISRGYYEMYRCLSPNKKPTKEEIKLFAKSVRLFQATFREPSPVVLSRYKLYRETADYAHPLIEGGSVIAVFTLYSVMLMQSCHSNIHGPREAFLPSESSNP
jgi:phosphate uptake regulator